MNPPSILGFKRSLQAKLIHAKRMYAQRRVDYWYDRMRRCEIALDCLAEYILKAEKG